MRAPEPRLIEVVRVVASAHGLDPVLVAAIVQKESSWNPWAMRYEPGYRWLYPSRSEVYRSGVASLETEKAHQMTSWGLMQVMGAVARERGCTFPFMSGLCLPEMGVEYGCRHLVWLRDRWSLHGDERLCDLISAYNAGRPTPDNRTTYVDPILGFMEELAPIVEVAA
jgi:soluble lytic murein transglycosylase-like protein